MALNPSPSAGKTGSSIVWMLIGSGGQTFFQFFLFIVLARKLGPEAFGIVAIASSLIDITNYIGRAGLSEVLIQQRQLEDDQADTAFWSSAGFGLLLTILLWLSAQSLASAFGVPGLKIVIQWLAPVSLFFALGAVYEAKLRRSFAFKSLAARNVSATFISGSVSIVMALTGFGVFSLVAQRLIYIIWIDVAMVLATRWYPRPRFHVRTSVVQLKAGSAIAASTLLGIGNQRIIDLIVGYYLGPVALGYLRIAWRALDLLLELSIRPVTAVTLTSLSQLQDDRAALNRAYVHLVRMTALFTYPLFLGAALVAPELLVGMFGNKWQASILAMQILTGIGFFVPLIYYKSNALMAVGNMRQVLMINIIEFIVSVIVALISSQFGLEGAALGNVIRMLLITPIIMGSLRRHVGIPADETLICVWPSAAATVIMLAVLAWPHHVLGPLLPPLALVAVIGALAAIVYLGALWVLKPSLVRHLMAFARSAILPMLSRVAPAPKVGPV